MPMYDYACGACGHRFEVRQSMRDDALTECPQCHGQIRRVIHAPAIVFKGSGFYKTDSRPAENNAASTPAAPEKSGQEEKKEGAAAALAAENKPAAEGAPATPKKAEPAKSATPAAAGASSSTE